VARLFGLHAKTSNRCNPLVLMVTQRLYLLVTLLLALLALVHGAEDRLLRVAYIHTNFETGGIATHILNLCRSLEGSGLVEVSASSCND
jgi:hypothetical protein